MANWKEVLLVCMMLLCFKRPANAAPNAAPSKQEFKSLLLFFKMDELVSSPTRAEIPVSHTAEDITVITAHDIELMGAHTLADVLFTVTGVQVLAPITPGFPSSVSIQGSDFRHVRVEMDGVELNDLSDGVADVGSIPVQNIERIEIIKGPASSAWGSALGGIINIITKKPARKAAGSVYASYGERNTGDFRAELTGSPDAFGYYIYGGRLQSGGFQPNTGTAIYNDYLKVSKKLSKNVDVNASGWYSNGVRGIFQSPQLDLSEGSDTEYYYGAIGLDAKICGDCDLELSGNAGSRRYGFLEQTISTGLSAGSAMNRDDFFGGTAKFTYKSGAQVFVAGSEINGGRLVSDMINGGEHRLDKWAFYGNDTVSIKRFSFVPGIRYDHTNTNGGFVSPSIGVVYSPAEYLVLRGDVARGFNIPPLIETFGYGALLKPNPDLRMEKVWSYHLGVETDALKYLWLKATVFRNDITDELEAEQIGQVFQEVNKGKARREGYELEAKTAPYYNTSFSAGFTYIKTTDRETGQEESGVPQYTWDLGAQYETKGLKGLLHGRYTWWNSSGDEIGKYNGFIWDVNLIKTIYRRSSFRTDVFLTAHNIFDGSQYPIYLYLNARRWFETGINLKF